MQFDVARMHRGPGRPAAEDSIADEKRLARAADIKAAPRALGRTRPTISMTSPFVEVFWIF